MFSTRCSLRDVTLSTARTNRSIDNPSRPDGNTQISSQQALLLVLRQIVQESSAKHGSKGQGRHLNRKYLYVFEMDRFTWGAQGVQNPATIENYNHSSSRCS